MITEQEMQRILSLADKIQMEVNRMCVTDDIDELDTMSIHIREDLRKLRDLRYEKLSDNNDIKDRIKIKETIIEEIKEYGSVQVEYSTNPININAIEGLDEESFNRFIDKHVEEIVDQVLKQEKQQIIEIIDKHMKEGGTGCRS